jgi:ATP-binding cassette subfamily B protein
MNLKEIIFNLLLAKKRYFLLCIISILVSTALGLINPLILKFILDDIIIKNNFSLLPVISIILICIIILETSFSFFNKFIFNLLIQVLEKQFKLIFLKKLTNISYNEFASQPAEEYVNNYSIDISAVFSFITELFDFVLSVLFSFIFIVFILFYYNFTLACLSLFFLPVYILVLFFSRNYFNNRYTELRDLYGREIISYRDNIEGMKTIRLFNSIDYRYNIFKSQISFFSKKIINCSIYENILSSILYAISVLSPTIIIIFGIRLFFENEITIGILIVFYTYIFQLIPLINRCVNFFYSSQKIKNSYKKLSNIFLYEEETDNGKNSFPLVFQSLLIDNVSYIQNNKEILQNINFQAAKGDIICLFGSNGSGKSTILNCISGIIKPTKGIIAIDGINQNTIDREYYNNKMCYLTQECILLNDTIYNNITLGFDVSTNKVYEICEKLKLLDFIFSLKNNFDFYIENNGEKFSGGERKMICLARILIRNPKIVLFDEFTNELDFERRLILYDLIKTELTDKITIFVTHNKNEMELANKFIYIDNGCIKNIERAFNGKDI